MSVVELGAESTIAAIVEAMLPRFGSLPEGADRQMWHGQGPTKALYIAVGLSLSTHSEDGEYEDAEHNTVHLIFERPSNYTKVFVCVQDAWGMPAPEAFEMRSNHDSCWRTDGLRDLPSVYFRMLHAMRERESNLNLKINHHHTIRKIEWVEITFEDGPEEPRRKVLTRIKRLPQAI